jgi:hypothetical protein
VFASRGLPCAKVDDIGVFEDIAGTHVDTLARGGFAQSAQTIADTSEWNRLLARIEDLARLARLEKEAVVVTRLAVGVKLQNNSLQYSPELVTRLAAGMASDPPRIPAGAPYAKKVMPRKFDLDQISSVGLRRKFLNARWIWPPVGSQPCAQINRSCRHTTGVLLGVAGLCPLSWPSGVMLHPVVAGLLGHALSPPLTKCRHQWCVTKVTALAPRKS